MKKTFDYTNKLKTLPIPSLQHTIDHFLTWITPLISEQQLRQTEETAHAFLREEGPILQQLLYHWNDKKEDNWLKPLWNESYLQHRSSLPLTMNFNVLLESISQGEEINLAEVVTKIGLLSALFYHDIIDENIPPEMIREEPVDMEQFRSFFCSARIPKKDKDEFYVAPYQKEYNYIVLLYKQNIIKIPVTDQYGHLYDAKSIEDKLQAVLQNVTEKKKGHLFTVAPRNDAAILYEMMETKEENKTTLQTIQDALLLVTIDDESQSSAEAIEHLMLDEQNKYFDKTIQIAVTKYGEIGFNIEHTAVDGTAIASFIEYMSYYLRDESLQLEGQNYLNDIPVYSWNLSEKMQVQLQRIEETYQQEKENLHLQFDEIASFGSNEIKTLRLSPDAFFHMALQLAYYRTYGEFRSVYEPVAMRTFKGGRTDCARATSEEKCELVYAIENGENAEYIYTCMQKASIAHRDRLQLCQQGFGIERHFFGLEKMYQKFGAEAGLTEKPALFLSDSYKTLRHDSLSTSGTVYANAITRMFAPTVPDGHGIAYIILSDRIIVSMSSFAHNKKQGLLLMKHLEEALDQLKAFAKETVYPSF